MPVSTSDDTQPTKPPMKTSAINATSRTQPDDIQVNFAGEWTGVAAVAATVFFFVALLAGGLVGFFACLIASMSQLMNKMETDARFAPYRRVPEEHRKNIPFISPAFRAIYPFYWQFGALAVWVVAALAVPYGALNIVAFLSIAAFSAGVQYILNHEGDSMLNTVKRDYEKRYGEKAKNDDLTSEPPADTMSRDVAE